MHATSVYRTRMSLMEESCYKLNLNYRDAIFAVSYIQMAYGLHAFRRVYIQLIHMHYFRLLTLWALYIRLYFVFDSTEN